MCMTFSRKQECNWFEIQLACVFFRNGTDTDHPSQKHWFEDQRKCTRTSIENRSPIGIVDSRFTGRVDVYDREADPPRAASRGGHTLGHTDWVTVTAEPVSHHHWWGSYFRKVDVIEEWLGALGWGSSETGENKPLGKASVDKEGRPDARNERGSGTKGRIRLSRGHG